MLVSLEIPDHLATELLSAGKNPSCAVLEAFALEGYRSGHFSEEEVRVMLGYETRMEVHILFKEHSIFPCFSAEDVERDTDTVRRVLEDATAEKAAFAA